MLENKVILVTGSSTGIGKATAELCLAAGAKLMIHGLDEAETQATAGALGQPYLANDLGLAASADALIDYTLEHYGRLDGLVNNAATTARSTLQDADAATFDRIVSINARAPLLLIRAAMAQFKTQGGASVVNIGSVNAHCGLPNLVAYSMSKAALTTLTRNLANAYASDGVRVNQLNPGWVLSENEIALQISEGQAPDWYKHVGPEVAPRGEMLEPEDVARHAVYWLSDSSAPVSGVVYDVEQFPPVGGRVAVSQH